MREEYDALQRMVDGLFRTNQTIVRLDAILWAEAAYYPDDLLELVNLLPPGRYSRQRLCDQLNSSLKGHGWTRYYATVD